MDKVGGIEKKSGVIEIFLAVGSGVKYASYMTKLRIEGFEVGDHFSGTHIESKAYFIRTIQTNSINTDKLNQLRQTQSTQSNPSTVSSREALNGK